MSITYVASCYGCVLGKLIADSIYSVVHYVESRHPPLFCMMTSDPCSTWDFFRVTFLDIEDLMR